MRNTFAVFAQDAEIAAKASGSTLELTWSRQDETAVLQADFSSCAFTASVRDAGGERFRLQQ